MDQDPNQQQESGNEATGGTSDASGTAEQGIPAEHLFDADESIDIDQLMLIVVGAHLRAELTDRQLAYRLREQALRHLDALEVSEDLTDPLTVVVCTDLWYLNHNDLLSRPTIAIGDPDRNAASAYLGSRIPTAFVVDDSFRVHLDMEYIELRACLWGVSHGATVSAVDLFVERYLNGFLRSAHDLPLE